MSEHDFQEDSHPAVRSGPPIDPLEVRSNPRVGTDVAVEIYASDFGGALYGRTRDLSIGGACIATPSPFAYKSLHSIVLKLADRDLKVDVEGCWQREDPSQRFVLTGIAFDRPPPETLEVIWESVLDAGKRLARFLYERTALHELGLEEAMGLAQVTRFQNASVGDAIYRQGDRSTGSDSIFMIAEGSIALQVRVRDAIDLPLARLEVGDLFGGLPLLADLPHAESAIAATDVKLFEIDASAFRHLRSMKPWLGHRLGVALLRVHAQRMNRVLGLASETL